MVAASKLGLGVWAAVVAAATVTAALAALVAAVAAATAPQQIDPALVVLVAVEEARV